MKNKTEQVEIMTKALISRCHGLYSQEALGNEIMDFADRVVKLLTTPDVSKCDSIERRNLLIDFGNQVVEIQNRYHCILQDVEKEVDAYLKSNNNC